MAEKGSENYLDNQGNYRSRDTASYGASGTSVASAVADRQKQAQSQLAAAAERAKKKTPMPKQMEGESAGAYSERLRQWRASGA